MIEVVNSIKKIAISYDGKKLDGNPKAVMRASLLIAKKVPISIGDPYKPKEESSLEDSPAVLLAVLRHAVAPDAPFAGFVKVSVDGKPTPAEPFNPAKPSENGLAMNPSATPQKPGKQKSVDMANFSLLRYKSEVARRQTINKDDDTLFKVGLVQSNNPIMRAGQAAASIAIPGDLSDVRRPVRSTLFEALTPGGGGDNRSNLVRRALGREKRNQLRCPPGFENGGQFTNRNLTTCGLRLFDLPGFGLFKIDTKPGDGGPGRTPGTDPKLAETIDSALPEGETTIRRAAQIQSTDAPNTEDPNVSNPTAQPQQSGIDISRIALINPVGELDTSKREASIKKAAAVAAEANSPDFGRLVRRDGTMLDNVVPVVRLADVRNSDDMEQGFMVTAISDPMKFAESEFQVLSAGLDGIVMVTPDGKGFIRLERSGAGAGSIRGMRRRWGTLLRDQESGMPGVAFDQLVQEAGKKLKLSIQYPGIEDPMAMVEIQRGSMKRNVRRWVYALFLSQEAPLRPEGVKAWSAVEGEAKK